MVILTGDTHGSFERLGTRHLRDFIGEGDYLIIAGDCGLCWAKDKEFEYWLKWFSEKKFTTLFVDGNHENFDMLEEYPVELWHGGKVHHILKDKVIHLMRGQVFEIEGKKIFTFGGAQSHDISGGLLDRNDVDFKEKRKIANSTGLPYRIIGESWWKQEMPSEEEMEEGRRNLKAHNWQVDYIITHSICTSKLPDIGFMSCIRKMKSDVLTDYLEEIENKTKFNKWYCGHYHMDWNIDDKHSVLYKQLIEMG